MFNLLKINYLINHFRHQIFVSKYDKLFISKQLFSPNVDNNTKKILLQMPEEYFYVITFRSLIENLSKKHNLQIHWIRIGTDYQKTGSTYFIKKILPYGLKWVKLYSNLGGKIILNFEFGLFKWLCYIKQAFVIYTSIKSKKELLDFKIDGILIGDLIYDSYLRYRSKPTLDIKDFFLFRLIISSLFIFDKSKKYFSVNRPDALYTSYTAYLHHGIPVRFALSKGIVVYSLGAVEIFLNKINKNFPYHLKDYTNYKSSLSKVNDIDLEILKDKSRELLDLRFNGFKDSATHYMKNSSYFSDIIKSPFFINSTKPRVVIFVHDFYDSPHVRRWLLFEDFYEWLYFILSSICTDNDYFLKLHPNSSNETITIINDILIKFPFVKLIPMEISGKKLIEEGFDLAITNHGTVAHELPLFNIPVLCSGDNPHITFNFCYTATTLDEFKNLIQSPLNVRKLINWECVKEEVFSFYSIHNLYDDDLPISKDEINIINRYRNIESEDEWIEFVMNYDVEYSLLNSITGKAIIKLESN